MSNEFVTCRECNFYWGEEEVGRAKIGVCNVHRLAVDPYALRRPGDCGYEKKVK